MKKNGNYIMVANNTPDTYAEIRHQENSYSLKQEQFDYYINPGKSPYSLALMGSSNGRNWPLECQTELDTMSKSDRPARKHQPRGLPILHEDKDIIVVVKPAGLLTIGTDREKERTVHYLLNDYVRKGNPKSPNRVYVVHRLDKDTSGVLLFAKSEQAKKFLQENWENTEKHYLAIVHGRLTAKEGTISSYLVENKAQRVYSTPDPSKGKLSHTVYKVSEESKKFSLLDIHLLTGRKHQIRVHFAEKGHPVFGDRKYGNQDSGSKRLALHSRSISFTHPFTHKLVIFDTGIPEDLIRLFRKL